MNTKGIEKEHVKGHWMQDVSASIKKSGHKGIFSEAAKRAGKSTREYAEMNKHKSGKIGQRARLALVFLNSNHK